MFRPGPGPHGVRPGFQPMFGRPGMPLTGMYRPPQPGFHHPRPHQEQPRPQQQPRPHLQHAPRPHVPAPQPNANAPGATHQMPRPTSYDATNIKTDRNGAGGVKRFGDTLEANLAKRPTPSPLLNLPTQAQQTQQQSPAIVALRSECQALVASAPASDMALLAASAVIGDLKPNIDALPGEFVEGTYGSVTKLLGLQPNVLPMFRQRVCASMHTDLVSFMERVFQSELSNLLVATTHQTPHQDTVLRNKMMQIVATASGEALAYIKVQALKFRELRTSHPAGQPAASQPVQPVSSPENEAKLADAALANDLTAAAELLGKGTNINAAPQGGWTPLMNATLQGHLDMVQYLISRNANLNLKDDGGFTALMYAASYKWVQIAELLVASGADLNVTDNAGRSISQYPQDPSIKSAIERGKESHAMANQPQQPAQQEPSQQQHHHHHSQVHPQHAAQQHYAQHAQHASAFPHSAPGQQAAYQQHPHNPHTSHLHQRPSVNQFGQYPPAYGSLR